MKLRDLLWLIFLSFALHAKATIVNFSGVTKNERIPVDYASNIASNGTAWSVSNGATPNVALYWSYEEGVKTNCYQHWDFYNDTEWPGVAQMNDSCEGTKYWITFTPDSGYGVILDSFVFDDYVNFDGDSDFSWRLYQDSTNGTVIASGTIAADDGERVTINTGMSSAYAGSVVFEIFNNQVNVGEHGTGEAIDDITFRQVTIPEPAVVSFIFVIGLGLIAIRRLFLQ